MHVPFLQWLPEGLGRLEFQKGFETLINTVEAQEVPGVVELEMRDIRFHPPGMMMRRRRHCLEVSGRCTLGCTDQETGDVTIFKDGSLEVQMTLTRMKQRFKKHPDRNDQASALMSPRTFGRTSSISL